MSADVPDPRPALTEFGVSAICQPHAPGFSGASVWRVAAGNESFALKAYAPGWGAANRLMAIHQRLRDARRSGIHFVPCPLSTPNGRSAVEYLGRLWDLVTWLPGAPLLSTQPTTAEIGAAMRALAELHQTWRGDANQAAACQAVVRRLVALTEWDSLQPLPMKRDTPLDRQIGDALARLPRLTEEARRILEPWRDRAVAVQTTFGDLWHAHVLFVGGKVTGLIDHAAVKSDHVVADLARLIGSLGRGMISSQTPLADNALAAYQTVRRLTATELALLDALLSTGPAVQLTQWVRWLALERRPFPDPLAVARRLAFLLEQSDGCLPSRILVN